MSRVFELVLKAKAVGNFDAAARGLDNLAKTSERVDKTLGTKKSVQLDTRTAEATLTRFRARIEQLQSGIASGLIDEKDILKADAEIKRLTRSVDKLEAELNGVTVESKRAFSGFAGIGNGLRSLVGVASAAVVGKFLFDVTAQAETAAVAFETLTGSAAGARDLVAELQAYSNRTPFEFADVQEATKRLLAFGFSAQESVGWLESIGNAAATTGQPLGELATIFGQIESKGRLQGEEALQLAERGINAYKILADASGLTTAEVMKLGEQGKLLAKDVLPALKAGLDEAFAGGTDKQAETLAGKWSTLKDAGAQLGRTIGDVLAPAVKTFLDLGTSLLNIVSSLPAPITTTAVGIGVFAAVVKGLSLTPLYSGLAATAASLRALPAALAGATSSFASFRAAAALTVSAAAGPFALAIAGIVAGLAVYQSAQAEADARARAFADTLDEFGRPTQQSIADTGLKIRELFPDESELKAIGTSYEDLTRRVITGDRTILDQRRELADQAAGGLGWFLPDGQTASKLSELYGIVDDGSTAWEREAAAKRDSAKITKELNLDNEALISSMETLSKDAGDLAKAYEEQAQAAYAVQDATQSVFDTLFIGADRWTTARKAEKAYLEQRKESRDQLKNDKRFTLSEKIALADWAAAARESASARLAAGEAAASVGADLDTANKRILEAAKKAGASKGDIEELTTALNLVPGNVTTNFTITGLQALQAAEQSVKGIYSAAGIGYTGGAAYNLYIQEQMKLVAPPGGLPVKVENWPGGRTGYTTTSSGKPIPERVATVTSSRLELTPSRRLVTV